MGPYQESREVESLEECCFYHTTDLPGHGTVTGAWDLRPNIDRYLGGVDFRGRRVLDVGAASGFLSFHMEKKGAEVVSYDLPEHLPWDFVPFAGTDQQQFWELHRPWQRKLNNSWWYSHRLLGSRAKLVHGSVYAIPQEIGPVDIAVLGSILLHLRDPFLALQNAVQLAQHQAIVTDVVPRRYLWQIPFGRWCPPRMEFLPRLQGHRHFNGWWVLNVSAVRRMLEVLGFEKTRVSYHRQMHEGRTRWLFTIVGERTLPAPIQCQPPAKAA